MIKHRLQSGKSFGLPGRPRAWVVPLEALGVPHFWLGAGVFLAFLAVGAVQGFGAEVAIWREVPVHGEDLAGQLARPVAEMKQQLANEGCDQVSLAYWSLGVPLRLRVEVRCLGTYGARGQRPDVESR